MKVYVLLMTLATASSEECQWRVFNDKFDAERYLQQVRAESGKRARLINFVLFEAEEVQIA